jgi:glycosyltransferase involved in cell wall biosynthesis
MAILEERLAGQAPPPPGREDDVHRPPPGRPGIACISSAPWNPYLELLYGHLAAHGLELVPGARFSLRWLWRARARVGFVHFHWPEVLHRFERGPRALRALLSWVKLGALAVRLLAARALGYRLVWTIHQVYPHESRSGARDHLVAALLARLCHVLIAHDRSTRRTAIETLGRAAERVAVVPHGSYTGIYPGGRARRAVRDELGLPADAFVFLSFGELRPYKGTELLLEAFAKARLANAALVVAGNPKDPGLAEAVRAAAAADPRIKPLLGFVPNEGVAELFGACDAAVLARADGGTSGSLILALSLGLPAVAATAPTYEELTDGENAGWLFRADDAESLTTALERAAGDPAAARAKRQLALAIAQRLSWPEIAAKTARLLLADER